MKTDSPDGIGVLRARMARAKRAVAAAVRSEQQLRDVLARERKRIEALEIGLKMQEAETSRLKAQILDIDAELKTAIQSSKPWTRDHEA